MLLQLGQSTKFSLLVTDINGNRVSNDTPIAIIKDLQANKFWNGIIWSDTEASIMLLHIENGIYSYEYAPDKIGVYQVSMTSETYDIATSTVLDVREDINGTPGAIVVSSETLLAVDGTNCTVMQKGQPLLGVKVSVYDKSTKDVVARTFTDADGKWQVTIVPGTYFFVFEKEGCVSITLERMVV